jgi:hypothetical protein
LYRGETHISNAHFSVWVGRDAQIDLEITAKVGILNSPITYVTNAVSPHDWSTA